MFLHFFLNDGVYIPPFAKLKLRIQSKDQKLPIF